MPDRPTPDIEHTREALRQHDEREREDQELASEDAEPEEEKEPEPPE